MMEKFVRSPILMMALVVMLGVFFIGMEEGLRVEFFLIPFLIFYIVNYTFIILHNRRHPERKIDIITWIPYELREEDEGLQYITFKAMRKVYIFYYYAVPISLAFTVTFGKMIPYFNIGLLVLFGIAQYFIYWLEIRKAFIEEE